MTQEIKINADDVKMKGYKAYEKGLICRGKQYAENTVFEEPKAEICKSGMHFCRDPFDVLDYYMLVNNNGEMSEFTEVEALDEAKTNDDKKYCTTKMKVGAKLDLKGFIKACIDFTLEVAKKDGGADGNKSYAQLASLGDDAKLASSGDGARLASSDNYAQLASLGDDAKLASSGYGAQHTSSGNYAKHVSSGDRARLASLGDGAQLASSGDGAQLASLGDYARLASSDNYAQLASLGNSARLASLGDGALLASLGDGAQLASLGGNSVIMCAGANSKAKAAIGSWITLSEWDCDGEKYIPVCVKTEQVDGEKIKADTFYALRNGEFTEV